MKTFAQWVIALTRGYIKATGKKPDKLAKLRINMEAGQKVKDQKKVIEFPQDRITDWTKPRPTTGKKADVTELDEPLVNELAITETLASPTRIKQGFSTQSKLNHWSQNQKQVSDFISRKNREFNSLNAEDQKSVLDMFEKQIKKHMPKERKAGGGIAGMLGERTGYKEGREAQRRPLSDREDWYTDKIIADNLGRIKNAMYMKYILPEKWSRSLESLTDEDFYGEYDERKGHTGIFKKFFETKEGEKIDLPYKPDEGVDVTGLLEAMEGKGVSKDYKVKKRKSIELKGGGLAGMLGEPTYQDDSHRVPFKDAKLVEGPYMPPQNIYDIGFGSILDDVMRGSPKKRYTEKDFKNIWNILQGDSDLENWEDELMLRFGRFNPEKKSNIFLELGKDKKGIGYKKQIDFNKLLMGKAEGGRVPFSKGKSALQGLAKLFDEFFPGTTKIGQTSKPLAKKTKLKKAVAEFQEREKAAKIRETIKADEKALAKLKKEHKEKYTDEYGYKIGHHKRSDEMNKQSSALWKKIDDLQYKIDDNRYLVDDVVIDGKKYKLSDKDRPPTKEELDDKYAELWDDENSPWDFGSTVREMDAALAEARDYERYMYQQYKMGKLDPKPGEISKGRLELLRERADSAYGDPKMFTRDEMDELDVLENHFAQVDKEESFQFAERVRKAKEEAKVNKKSPWFKDSKTPTPEEELRREFPGISDDLIKNILADKNPQRIAEVKATLHEALKMQEKGMGHEEIIKIFKKKPIKHASGGLAGMLGE